MTQISAASMAAVDTGTVCRFPFIWPTDSPVNITTATSADCTQTYAERIGVLYYVVQLVALIIPIFSLAVLSYQLFALRRYTRSQNSVLRVRDNASFPFVMCAWWYNIFLIIQAIDLFGFRNVLPIELYVIVDEFAGAALMSLAMLLVDFWIRCAKVGGASSRHGFEPKVQAAFMAGIAVNFFGWIIVSVCDPDHFRIYKAIKSFGYTILLSVFQYIATVTVQDLQRTLSSSSLHEHQPTATVSEENQRAANVLMKKFRSFSIVVILAAIIMFVNAIIVLNTGVKSNSWHWEIPFFSQPDFLQLIIRALYLTGSLIALSFFGVPKTKATAYSNQQKMQQQQKNQIGNTDDEQQHQMQRSKGMSSKAQSKEMVVVSTREHSKEDPV